MCAPGKFRALSSEFVPTCPGVADNTDHIARNSTSRQHIVACIAEDRKMSRANLSDGTRSGLDSALRDMHCQHHRAQDLLLLFAGSRPPCLHTAASAHQQWRSMRRVVKCSHICGPTLPMVNSTIQDTRYSSINDQCQSLARCLHSAAIRTKLSLSL